jgi:hypothetical protein
VVLRIVCEEGRFLGARAHLNNDGAARFVRSLNEP